MFRGKRYQDNYQVIIYKSLGLIIAISYMINILLRTSLSCKATLLLTNKSRFTLVPILKDSSVVPPPTRNSLSTFQQKIDKKP